MNIARACGMEYPLNVAIDKNGKVVMSPRALNVVALGRGGSDRDQK